jgi:hypothetical protein
MKKAQISTIITILCLSVLLLVNTSLAGEDLGDIMDGEIGGMELHSSIKETEVASLPRLGTEVTLVEIYNENLELIAFGTAHESRILKLAHKCDLITTIAGKQFFRQAYEHE